MAFFLVYIREAHPNLLKKVPEGSGPRRAPKELAERAVLAGKCMAELKLSLPVLLDDMDGSAEKAYQGWPDRIVVIDIDGNVAYPGRRGPSGFRVTEAEEVILRLLAARSATTRRASTTRAASGPSGLP